MPELHREQSSDSVGSGVWASVLREVFCEFMKLERMSSNPFPSENERKSPARLSNEALPDVPPALFESGIRSENIFHMSIIFCICWNCSYICSIRSSSSEQKGRIAQSNALISSEGVQPRISRIRPVRFILRGVTNSSLMFNSRMHISASRHQHGVRNGCAACRRCNRRVTVDGCRSMSGMWDLRVDKAATDIRARGTCPTASLWSAGIITMYAFIVCKMKKKLKRAFLYGIMIRNFAFSV